MGEAGLIPHLPRMLRGSVPQYRWGVLLGVRFIVSGSEGLVLGVAVGGGGGGGGAHGAAVQQYGMDST